MEESVVRKMRVVSVSDVKTARGSRVFVECAGVQEVPDLTIGAGKLMVCLGQEDLDRLGFKAGQDPQTFKGRVFDLVITVGNRVLTGA